MREQFRFLECAARSTGDAYFGARLGQVVRIKELSSFGTWVCRAATLLGAIGRAQAGLNTMLQTSTLLALERRGPTARWSIEFLEPETDGRRHNELLGISYLIDTVRTFAGRCWRPAVVMTTLPRGAPRAELEDIFGTNISHGHRVTSIDFEASLLSCGGPGNRATKNGSSRIEPNVPREEDVLAKIGSVTDLALHAGYPRMDWVASKLGTTRRSLQRILNQHGTTFHQLAEERLLRHAKVLLDGGSSSVTEIALELGYRDPAHFTRAFRRWTGISPTAYQNAPIASDIRNSPCFPNRKSRQNELPPSLSRYPT